VFLQDKAARQFPSRLSGFGAEARESLLESTWRRCVRACYFRSSSSSRRRCGSAILFSSLRLLLSQEATAAAAADDPDAVVIK
jgi:hypothetical protein